MFTILHSLFYCFRFFNLFIFQPFLPISQCQILFTNLQEYFKDQLMIKILDFIILLLYFLNLSMLMYHLFLNMNLCLLLLVLVLGSLYQIYSILLFLFEVNLNLNIIYLTSLVHLFNHIFCQLFHNHLLYFFQ